MNTLISLVIPTFNRADFLEQALTSIAAAAIADPAQVEVIVVDNNCTDRTAAVVETLAERFPCRLRRVTETHPGSSSARNCGLREADGYYVAFMDDDQLMECHYLGKIAETFAATGAVCIGGPVTYYNAEHLPHWLRELSKTIGQISFGDQIRILGPETHKGLFGGNMAFIGDELRAAGGFNVRLGHVGNNAMGLEDLEIQDRLRRRGKTIGYSPHLIQYHYLRPERRKKRYWREYFYGYGRSAYIRRSVETGRERRSHYRIPVWAWRQLITRDVPAHLASYLQFDSFKRFRTELEIWTRLGQIHEAMLANARQKQLRARHMRSGM